MRSFFIEVTHDREGLDNLSFTPAMRVQLYNDTDPKQKIDFTLL